MEGSPPSSSGAHKELQLEPGLKLDRYELLCVLAHGGMATVWLARMTGKHGFEKLVAVKTMLPVHAENEDFRQMFLDEARIASQIEHPNVAQILDLGEQHGTLYLVMELVDGDPLQKLQRACEKQGAKVPLGIALRIVSDACAGLEAAHRLVGPDGVPMHVVHRDISPQNILVTTTGMSKVIDFGIAKARDRSGADTAAGTFKGKIQYMPREQALGKEIDQRSDVWAMGAVLYALCAGRPPYKDENQFATLQLLMNWAPIPALPANVPAPVAAVVMKALAHDPARRFQSAAEMHTAIDEAMARCNLTTTIAHVATFVAEHLKVRAETRKKAIEVALKEAQIRSRVQTMLKAAPQEQTTGTGRLPAPMPTSMPPPATIRGVGMPPVPPPPPQHYGGGTPAFGVPAAPYVGGPSALDATPGSTSQISQVSNGTLSAAAAGIEDIPPQLAPSKTKVIIGAAMVVVGLAIGIGALVAVSSGDSEPKAAAKGGTTTVTTSTAAPVADPLPPPSTQSAWTPVPTTTATATTTAAASTPPTAKTVARFGTTAPATAPTPTAAKTRTNTSSKTSTKKGDDDLGF